MLILTALKGCFSADRVDCRRQLTIADNGLPACGATAGFYRENHETSYRRSRPAAIERSHHHDDLAVRRRDRYGPFFRRQYGIKAGLGLLTVGNLIALASIPLMLNLFFMMLDPFRGRRYRLTNRRVIIERGVRGTPELWVDLDNIEKIEVVVQPGQEWYPAGDLIFSRGQVETFRLLGVSRPETFRQTILKAAQGYRGAAAATG